MSSKRRINPKYVDYDFISPYYGALLDGRIRYMEGVTDEIIYETELFADQKLVEQKLNPIYVISQDDYRGMVPAIHAKRIFELKQSICIMRMLYSDLIVTFIAAVATYFLKKDSAIPVLILGLVGTFLSGFLLVFFLTEGPTSEK